MNGFLALLLLLVSGSLQAFSWQNLWKTPNQQATELMSKEQFNQAKEKFTQPDWKATAAYRDKDYQQAAAGYQSLDTELGYYNQGNALANLHKYQQAIAAYNKALALNPNNADALHNRKLIESLLKKETEKKSQDKKQEQDKQDQDKQDQDKQDQDKQDQDKQDQDKQDQDKQDQDKQDQDKQDQDKQDKDKQDQDKQDQDKQDQDKQDQDKQDQDKQDQDKQDQDKQDQDKQDQAKKDKASQVSQSNKTKDKESQQAKEQWLRLIPDDPGGLMREKFWRDHLLRQQGWRQ